MTKGSDLLVDALENEGVEYVFGIPGEENLDFVESLRTSSIKLVLSLFDLSARNSCLLFCRKWITLDLLRQFCQSFLPRRIALS